MAKISICETHMLDLCLKLAFVRQVFVWFALSWHWLYDFNFKEHSTYLQSRSSAVVRPLFKRPTWIPTRWKIHPVLIFRFYRRLSQKLSWTWCSFEYKSSKFQPPHVHIFVCPLTYHAGHTTGTTLLWIVCDILTELIFWHKPNFCLERVLKIYQRTRYVRFWHYWPLHTAEPFGTRLCAPGLACSNHICPSLFLQKAVLLQAPEAWVWGTTRVSTSTITKHCYLH